MIQLTIETASAVADALDKAGDQSLAQSLRTQVKASTPIKAIFKEDAWHCGRCDGTEFEYEEQVIETRLGTTEHWSLDVVYVNGHVDRSSDGDSDPGIVCADFTCHVAASFPDQVEEEFV